MHAAAAQGDRLVVLVYDNEAGAEVGGLLRTGIPGYRLPAEVLDRESDVDMEQSLNAWDQSFHFLPGTGSRSWSPEVQLQSFGNEHLNWIAGANYFHEKTTTFGYFDNAIGEKSMFDQPDRSTSAYALFAQGTYSFTDQWHLSEARNHTSGGSWSWKFGDTGSGNYADLADGVVDNYDAWQDDPRYVRWITDPYLQAAMTPAP